MAMLQGVEIWFAKVNPERPNAKFNKKNPTWECQIRTYDKAKAKDWENKNIPLKAIIPDEGPPYWRANLRKKSLKVDEGTPTSYVEVVDGEMNPVDPDTIGNASIGNVRIFQYEYPREGGGKGIASVLMGIQLTKHILYTPKPRDDDFKETGPTEVIAEPIVDYSKKEETKVYGDEEVKKDPEEAPETPKASSPSVGKINL